MTIAVSDRRKIWARQVAQKVLISHIQNYITCLKWETALITNPQYYPVPLPTYEDYEHLVRDIEETGELQIVSGGENKKWMLVPTLNVIRYPICFEGKDLWYESRRPEDEGRKNVPDVAYFVADRNVLSNEKSFKSRKNFRKFINNVRAVFFEETNKEFAQMWVNQERRVSLTLQRRYRNDGMPEKEVQKIVRKTKIGNRKANHPSLRATPRRLVQKEFYPGKRKQFDKTLERLKEMGFWL
jgi:hypothetical protein